MFSCSLQHDKLHCHMFWEGEQLLHMGWADTVKVARVRAPAASSSPGEARRSLDIVASFQIGGCLIAVSFVLYAVAVFLGQPWQGRVFPYPKTCILKS